MSDLDLTSATLRIVDQPAILVKKEKIVFMNQSAVLLAGKDMTGKPVSLLIPNHITNTQASAFAASAFIGKRSCTVKVRAYEGYRIYTMLCDEPQSKPLDMLQTSVRSTLGNIKFSIDRITVMSEDIENVALDDCLCLLNRNYYKLKHTVDNICMMNALSDGSIVFNPVAVNITELCRKLIDTVGEMFRETDIKISLNSEEDLRIVADEMLVETLILNLLSNSIMNCKSDGKISVSLLKTEKHLILSVDDNGKGIQPEELSLVFDRYKYGVDLSRPQGAGLGLALVRGIAELHKGAVIIESRGEEKGASVRVMLSNDIPMSKYLSSNGGSLERDTVQSVLTHLSDCLPPECFSENERD